MVGHYTGYSCMCMQSMNLIWPSMWSGGVLTETMTMTTTTTTTTTTDKSGLHRLATDILSNTMKSFCHPDMSYLKQIVFLWIRSIKWSVGGGWETGIAKQTKYTKYYGDWEVHVWRWPRKVGFVKSAVWSTDKFRFSKDEGMFTKDTRL